MRAGSFGFGDGNDTKSEKKKQILRPAYPTNDSAFRGAPNARVLRMTPNLLHKLCGWDTIC